MSKTAINKFKQLASGKAICGGTTGINVANKISFFNKSNNKCITFHNQGLRVWECDFSTKKILFTDIIMGKIKRNFTCITIDENDTCAYLGTRTGDIIEIDL